MPRFAPLLVLLGCSTALPVVAQEPAPGVAEEFRRLDRNQDGRVTFEEAGARVSVIRSADADRSGHVSLEELREFLRERRSRKTTPAPKAEPKHLVNPFPEDAPVSESTCRVAGDYSAKRNGYSFLVMWNGEVLFERYDQGWTPESAHRLASGTKSFSGVMLAAAVKDELLTLDEPVAKTLTEWQSDPKLSKITYRHLLSLTSGIDPGGIGRVRSYRAAVEEVKAVQLPGKKFAYGPNAFQIFGEALRRKLEARTDLKFADPLAYLQDRVLDPIGMDIADWRRDADGMPNLPSGVWLTAREWAKFGEFLRQGGSWNGTTLIDAKTLTECLQGSEANPGYGLTFWLLGKAETRTQGAPGLEEGLQKTSGPLAGAYMAAGAGKQRLYVLPNQNLVVVRQGESRNFDDNEFLGRLLGLKP